MRNNQPVTNIEKNMPDGQTIVSTTDMKGRITSVNELFCTMAGMSREELIGKPHNVIRHPDMPEAAFKWLWDTLKKGDPWTGMVKNRCADGGYYWVQANVTAVVERGRVTGYISVRSKPTRQQIEQATKLYADINAGKRRLESKPILSHLNIFSRMKIWQQIIMLVVVVMVSLAGSWLLALQGLNHSYDGMKMAVNDGKVGKSVSDIDIYMMRSQVHILEVAHGNHEAVDLQELEGIEQGLRKMEKDLSFIESSDLSGQEKSASMAFVKAVSIYHDNVLAPAIRAIRNHNFDQVEAYVGMLKNDEFKKAEQSKHDFDALQIEISAEEALASLSDYENSYRNSIILAAASLIFSILFAWFVIKTLVTRLKYTEAKIMSISEGNYYDWVAVDKDDEIGSMLQKLKSMQIRQGYALEEINRVALESLRIKEALDSVSIPVQITDAHYNIFYMNHKATELFKQYERELAVAIPGFNADQLMGKNIDVFHKDLSHQRHILDALTQTYKSADIVIGSGLVVTITVTPVLDESGKNVGMVVEWGDRTIELAVEKELESMVQFAGKGDLTQRISLENKQGFSLLLSEQVNLLVSIVEHVVNDANVVFGALAEGRLTETIEREYEGSFNDLKVNANESVAKLQKLISEVNNIAVDVSSGASEVAESSMTLSDRTQQQAAAIEQTAASIEEVTSTVEHNTDNSRQASQLAVSTREQAESGGVVVENAIKAMSGISASSKKISDIIGVIDEIAFQTNLLALNAAVEAARAGEQGRGFAVVASEVRILAGRSAGAAKEIKALINTSVHNVEQGSKLVSQSGVALHGIVESVRKVSDVISEIASASEEQSCGIAQINQAITSMDTVIQQNAAMVEESAASGQVLNDKASELLEMVSAFDMGKGRI